VNINKLLSHKKKYNVIEVCTFHAVLHCFIVCFLLEFEFFEFEFKLNLFDPILKRK